MVELDVLIIGGYYGEGRRRGVISQFLLALADSKKNEGKFICSEFFFFLIIFFRTRGK